MDKKVLFVCYQSPVGAIWPNETFRTTFGMYGEDIEPAVMLVRHAVVSLSKKTAPESLGLLPLKIVQRFIKRYETPVYALKEDIQRFKVKDIDENYNATLIEEDKLSELFHEYDYVVFM